LWMLYIPYFPTSMEAQCRDEYDEEGCLTNNKTRSMDIIELMSRIMLYGSSEEKCVRMWNT